MLEAPGPARLIEQFANTVNLEYGTDAIATPAQLDTWLVEHELLAPGQQPDVRVHKWFLSLRAGVREQLGVHVGVDPAPAVLEAAAAVTRRLPILVGIAGPVLAPAAPLEPPETALAHLAIAWVHLRITGDAARLKRCAEHTCELVFWDESKNRSRRWCSMRVCGSRVKSRRYAARMAAAAASESAPREG